MPPAGFQCEFGCAKAEALVVDQTAFVRQETFFLDDFSYGIPELRYSWRQPVVHERGIDVAGIAGLIRNHDLVIGCLLRDYRDTRARLDLVLDLVAEAYPKGGDAFMAAPLLALVNAVHAERDSQADRRAKETAEQARIAAGDRS